MPPPNSKPRRPMRVAIAALAVSLAVMAALIVFLIWGRSAPTVAPAPSPSASPTPSPSATSSPSATPTRDPGESNAPTPSASAASTPVASPSPTPAATQSATTSTAASASTPSTASASPAPTMNWEGKATFEYFTAEVLSNDAVPDAEVVEDKAGLLVEVCVRRALDGTDGALITTDPWTLEDANGNTQTPQEPGYRPAFPASKQYPVGECARGFLTFDYVPADGGYAMLVYENGLGERAVWQFH